MSQGTLCPNLTKKFQKEVSKIANRNLSCVILLGGLSVNLNHLKRSMRAQVRAGVIGTFKCKNVNARAGVRRGDWDI